MLRLESIPAKKTINDRYGNLLLFWSQAETAFGKRQMVDVFFKLL